MLNRRNLLIGAAMLVLCGGGLIYTSGLAKQSAAEDRQVADIFLIVGQSNGQGRGTGGPSVPNGSAYMYSRPNWMPLKDPVGGATDGSAWPAFAVEWSRLTGHTAFIVEAARSSTSLQPGANPTKDNWDVEKGGLYAIARDKLVEASGKLPQDYHKGKTFIIWVGGETTADAIDGDKISAAGEEVALTRLVQAFASEVDMDGFVISELGMRSDGEHEDAWASVRDAQMRVAFMRGDTSIGFDRAKTFVPAKMKDLLHYSQDGLNEMGIGLAQSIAKML